MPTRRRFLAGLGLLAGSVATPLPATETRAAAPAKPQPSDLTPDVWGEFRRWKPDAARVQTLLVHFNALRQETTRRSWTLMRRHSLVRGA